MKRKKTRATARKQTSRPIQPSNRADRSGGFVTFDFAVEAVAPHSWPSVSVCMIVKNEAANLRPCLESLGDLPSEIIVVDTGSTDDTVEIARAMGAMVVFFEWVNDFAAARNESLRHATREWVFWIDADERLSPQALAQLKRAADANVAEAYSCLQSSREADGRCNSVDHIRLFRNGLGIRFTGAIHEAVGADVVRLGLRLARTNMVLDHLGYEDAETVRRKSARNLPIIEQGLALDPSRTDLLFYRGHAHLNLGDTEGGEADLSEYLSRTQRTDSFDYMRFWSYSVLIALSDRRRDDDKLESLLKRAVAEFPRHPHFLLALSRLRLRQGRAEESVSGLRTAYETMQTPVRGSRPQDAWVEFTMAEASRVLGKREEALRWAARARDHAPDWELAGTLLARLQMESERLPEADGLLSQLVPTATLPETWVLLSEMRHRQGRLDEAVAAVREAQARGLPEQQVDERLARIRATAALAATKTQGDSTRQRLRQQIQGMALLAQDDFLGAAECFAEAIGVAPTDPDNYRYLAAALRGLGREEEALEAWQLANHWAAQLRTEGVKN